MAKTTKAAQKTTEVKVDAKTMATQKNRATKLARHLKRHPNDVQSEKGFLGTPRSKPKTKGNYPEAKTWVYDEAGHKTHFVSESVFAKSEEIWEITRRIRDEERRAAQAKERKEKPRGTKSGKTAKSRSKA